MKVDALPIDPGPAGWQAILPQRTPTASLRGDTHANVVVIGAGFAGLSAAERLRQLDPALDVVVLDATAVGSGPAGRNSGFMIDLPHELTTEDYSGDSEKDRVQTQVNRAAIAFARDCQARYAMADEALRMDGKTNAAATESGEQHNRDYAKHLEAMNEPYRWLDQAAMKAMTGIDYYRSGLYTPGTAMLQPALYIQSLADGLVGAGVRLYEHSPVVDYLKQGDHWQINTPSGRVQAQKVILAVNGHLNSFGYAKNRLMHVHTYASITRPLTAEEVSRLGGQPNWGLTPAHPMGTTVRRISGVGGDRLIVRNIATFDASLSVPETRLHARIAKIHRRCFEARFPKLTDVAFEHVWGGRLCLSMNSTSVVGELEPGLFSANVQNGLGTALGTANGIRAAEMALNSYDSLLPPQAFAPPSRIVPEPIASIGANAVLRWREFRAGREF
ncbi:MAG: FAD-binding oxidoreductase [Gammaproteobacteria bacterium]|nr:FAD-binding oxidoreductase [Gammaproteobacteria bacterium]